MTDLEVTLNIQEPSLRLDKALLQGLESQGISISRAQLKGWLQESRVMYRNRPVTGSTLLGEGTHLITLLQGVGTKSQAAAADPSFFLPVVYEDENILVIHKKSGTPSLPHRSDETETAVNFALARIPSLAQVGKPGLEPGLLHRLDTQTSGLLVFAKNPGEFERLRSCWKHHQIKKYYRALVKSASNSPFPSFPLTLDFPLAHDAKSSKKMVALKDSTQRAIRGKPLTAITHLLKSHLRHEGVAKGTSTALDCEIQIETGVMHQIRCHLSTIGWPILGDTLYHGAPSQRIWLHAWRLKLPLKNGAILSLEAMLPPGWEALEIESSF